jgi:hypothetical protein
MNPSQLSYHLEEYKQVRADALASIAKTESYFGYAALASGAVYSWLLLNSVGLIDMRTACLRHPQALLILAWMLPIGTILLAALKAWSLSQRVRQKAAYLVRLEAALAADTLGWERCKLLAFGIAQWANRIAWISLFLAACVTSGIGMHATWNAAISCPK